MKLTTHLSTPWGWKAELALLVDLQRTVYPYKWLPISCRSGADQWKFADQRPTFYYWPTQPTTERTDYRNHNEYVSLVGMKYEFSVLFYWLYTFCANCAIDEVNEGLICHIRKRRVDKLWKEEVRRVGIRNSSMSLIIFRFIWKRFVVASFAMLLYVSVDLFSIVSLLLFVIQKN